MTDPLPWHAGVAPLGSLASDLLHRPVQEVARLLLGARLISTVGGVVTSGVIVETEAYGGVDDPASHAAVVAGRTARNASMFAPAGTAYVYRSYGIHWCVNVVTGPPDQPQAVLLRGLEPLAGEAEMLRRRGRRPVGAGPGRLCQALGIDGRLDGHDLTAEPLRLTGGWTVPAHRVRSSGRVGIRRAAERPWRFYVAGSSGVTPGPRPPTPTPNGA